MSAWNTCLFRPIFVLGALGLVLLFVVLAWETFPGINITRLQERNHSFGWEDNGISSSSQGKLWKARKRRIYSGARRSEPSTLSSHTLETPSVTCDRWAVVTTIFQPSKLCRQLRDLDGWCFVVVGDKKTNHQQWSSFANSSSNTYYLSPQSQQDLGYRIAHHLQWDHFGRKNIGYLFAIQRGAKVIWDTGDDNELRDEAGLNGLVDFVQSNKSIRILEVDTLVWNPYKEFRPVQARTGREEQTCWPRGFPMEFIKDPRTHGTLSNRTISASNIGVLQSLANHDPDIDAVYRLSKELPFSFLVEAEFQSLQVGKYAPFNAQATLWMKKSFWGMIMPVTVHGRVTDIWRSYFTETLMSVLGQNLAFSSPIVTQYRNAHSLIADLQSEIPLYTQARELTEWLSSWDGGHGATSLSDIIERLIIDVYEIGAVEIEDVKLYQAWLDDLAAIGYEFPRWEIASNKSRSETIEDRTVEPKTRPSENVAVCVSGQLRTLTMSITDADYPEKWGGMKTNELPDANMTVAESILEHLYPALGTPDVFMVTSTKESPREPKAGNLSTCEPLRPNGGLLSCSVPKEKPLSIRNDSIWDKFTYSRNEPMIQGLLQQLKGMYDCHNLIQKHSMASGKTYDWIVRLRPDSYVVKMPSLESLSLEAKVPTIWFSNRRRCCCGNEDIFGIGRADWMRSYLERILLLDQGFVNMPRGWIAEGYLRTILSFQGIALAEHQGIVVCPVKPKHRQHPSDP